MQAIAAAHSVSPFQVAIRWTLHKGIVAIPRSKCPDHIAENTDVFDWDLTAEEVRALDDKNEDYPYYWSPIPPILTL